jgi:hypothetical protein
VLTGDPFDIVRAQYLVDSGYALSGAWRPCSSWPLLKLYGPHQSPVPHRPRWEQLADVRAKELERFEIRVSHALA